MFGTPDPWYKRHKTTLLRVGGGLVGLLLLVQLVFPYDRLPLFASIDGVSVGGWTMKDATWHLDDMADRQSLDVKLGDSVETYDDATAEDIGLDVRNEDRVGKSGYPLLIRLIPTSILWYGPFQADTAPRYVRDTGKAAQYLNDTLGGESCNIPAKNATVEFADDTLAIVGAKNGGTCKENEAVAALASVSPRLDIDISITIPVEVIEPTIKDTEARELKDRLLGRTSTGIRIKVGDRERTIPQKDVLSWLKFSGSDSAKLNYIVLEKRASVYFAKNITPDVRKAAGTTRVATRDFTVTSRKVGATGRTLALKQTTASVKKVLDTNDTDIATAVTAPVAPKVTYNRTYTKTSTGIAALMRFYDQDNTGVFGVSFRELGGKGRSAGHDQTKRFTTASTYKLFVAYGTMRKVDTGKWKWSDQNIHGGRNLATCFDDMIVKSDNPCAEKLLVKLGFTELTRDIQKLGLTGSGFLSGASPHTTAADLTLFLTKLQNDTLPIKEASRDRLLGAMKRNVYRQGVPTGASGTVADKVGFLNGLLHDAAIVYSPTGTYVLTILTDGSSWASIADLTRKIEALR